MSCRFLFMFKNLPWSEATGKQVRTRAAELEGECGPLAHCEADVEARHRRAAPGSVQHVRITLRKAACNSPLSAECQHDDLAVAIDCAFAELRRQLAGRAKARGSEALPAEGHILELLPEHGYGVVRTGAGATLPVRREERNPDLFEHLHVGDRVWFVPEQAYGKRGAKIVHVAHPWPDAGSAD